MEPEKMTLPELDASRLYVFVCGPGQGESIAIRVPPDHWIVIDSCRTAGQVFAKALFKKYEGRKACLVLTHRHRDHYRGFSDLAEMPDWQFVACNDRTLIEPSGSEDLAEKLVAELSQALALIRRRWLKNDGSQWETWQGSTRSIGNAQLIALHPDEKFAKEFKVSSSADENELSSAMVLRWKNNLILLGADTPNPHWNSIKEHFAAEFDPSGHVFAKIPHHGSRESLDPSLLSGAEEQTWVVTPYSSRVKLPNFASGQGLEYLIERNAVVYMTGLPVGHASQPPFPCQTTLADLQSGKRPQPLAFTLPGLVGIDVTPIRGDLKNYVVTAIDSDGRCEVVASADGTVVVERDGDIRPLSGVL